MAISESEIQQDIAVEVEEEKNLKYLDFVQVAAVHTVDCVSNLYGYARNNSGPLKPSVETVEGTVKTVVGPVYNKFHDVPIDVLKFVDRKVDESMGKVNNVSTQVKQVTAQAYSTAKSAPTIALSMATEVPRAGMDTATGVAKSVYAKYEPTAKELFNKYEPVAEQCAASTWRKLNQLPLFPRVAQVVVPTAAYCTDKYNQTVQSTAEKGYKVSGYLPLVPTEKIAKIFSNDAEKIEPLVTPPAGVDVSVH